MYLKIGNTKLLAGKFWEQGLAKIELNFEYLFSSHKSGLAEGETLRGRRFANIVVNLHTQELKIKIKSEFSNSLDCEKLSRLLIGIEKITTKENIAMIDQIIEGQSPLNPQNFLQAQAELLKYFL
ncbi:MAG: hypothetical protein QNJ55_14665 [Xenococcus sp. MO_188.B8]|nr:hypothetical protein [Xenococcus sp. MO_188.B8]